MTVYLNIGSNIGDRRAHIERAVALLSQAFPQARVRRDVYIESEPWGYASANAFVNLGIALEGIDPDLSPMEMLRITQSIEHQISAVPHRNADGTYADREIDIDIIDFGGLRLETPELQLPHPRAAERPFVYVPYLRLKEKSES